MLCFQAFTLGRRESNADSHTKQLNHLDLVRVVGAHGTIQLEIMLGFKVCRLNPADTQRGQGRQKPFHGCLLILMC